MYLPDVCDLDVEDSSHNILVTFSNLLLSLKCVLIMKLQTTFVYLHGKY